MRRITLYLVTFSLLVVVAGLQAIPRYSVERAQACRECHVDMSGAGMRTVYGNEEFAAKDLALPGSAALLDGENHSPKISEALQVGFDVRYTANDEGTVTREQTDLYVAIRPLSLLLYKVTLGQDGITENYAQLKYDGTRHFLKVGRFAPSFGLRLADTTAFVRQRTRSTGREYLNGAAAGTGWRGFGLTLEAFNVDDQDVFDVNAQWQGRLFGKGGFVGVSYRNSSQVGGSYAPYRHARAFYGGLNAGPFTFLGEIDLVGKSPDTLITYLSLSARPVSGLYISAEYDFFDGDRDLQSGVEEAFRARVDFFPIPFVQVRPAYTYYTEGPLKDEDELTVQLHVGY
ncbi:hypothetical protein GF377_07585 [candidate division GN15 bacterium]|nr:hypothetical protein [candidate division GN15 bacterium]